MTASRFGFQQGVGNKKFQVLDHRGYPANGECIAVTTADFGDLMYFSGENEVSRSGTGGGADRQYAGFTDSTVVASMDGMRVDVHGEKALVEVDKIALWNVGRYRVTNVVGSVSANALVYPAANGGLSATQTGTDRPVGICRVGNTAAGGPIEVEINLVGSIYTEPAAEAP